MSASSGTSIGPTTSNARGARPHGYWLLLARLGWILAALVILGLDVLGTQPYFQQMHVACLSDTSNTCLPHQLQPGQLRDLLTSGVSLDFFVAYDLVLTWMGTLVYAVLAAALFLRRPDDRMAMFGAYTLMVFGAGTVFGPLNALPAVSSLWAAVVSAINTVAPIMFYAFFCLFPSGRFAPRWMRWVALGWALGSVLSLIPYPPLQLINFDNNAFFVCFGLLVFAQVYRYQRVSTPREREQTKWVVLGFASGLGGFLAILLTLTFVPGVGSPSATFGIPLFDTALSMTLWLIPIFIAVAILRSRLWDIDILINKALVYGTLTVLLAAVYLTCVIAAQAIIQASTGRANTSPVITVASTLLVAALFSPLRRRIQAFIDRRFYRQKYDAAWTLSRFAMRLRTETNLEDLHNHVLAVVEETMRPAQVSLWLRERQRQPDARMPGKAPAGMDVPDVAGGRL